MDELGKRVTVAIRIRPKILSANNATQVAERYHPDACTKVGDSSIRLADTSMINGPQGDVGNSMGKEGRMNSFSFDYVFDQDSSQLEVYEETTLDAVDAALSGGCNATIMTYGQTGSGKTYTVLGAVGNNPLSQDVVTPETGLFLRVLKDILSYSEARASQVHVVVGLTVTEVYLDTVRDLLAPLIGGEPPTLKVVIVDENTKIPDLVYRPVSEIRDAVEAYRTATNRRVSRATEANDQSSRSHAIFSIDVYQQKRFEEINPDPLSLDELITLRDSAPAQKLKSASSTSMVKKPSSLSSNLIRKDSASSLSPSGQSITPPGSPATAEPQKMTPFDLSLASNPIIKVGGGHPPVVLSRIVLTDLAGSEKLKHSKAKGDALEEMKKINGSLTALGNVVHSLFSGSRHVPYRDSKLTVMLRTTFSTPNSRIVLIANCAPTALTFEETLSTMFFADKVKAMKVDDSTSASAARAAAAMQLEADVLRLSKEYEELAGDMRILARAYYNHKPIIRTTLLHIHHNSTEDFNIFRPSFGCRLPTGHTKQSKALVKMAEEKCFSIMTTRKEEEMLAQERACKAEHSLLLNNLVTSHRDSMARAREFMRTNEQSSKQMVAELDATLDSLNREVETMESILKPIQVEVSDIKLKAETLGPARDALEKEERKQTKRLEEANRVHMEKYKDEQDEWDLYSKQYKENEKCLKKQYKFFECYMDYLIERLNYFTIATAVEEERREVLEAQSDLSNFDITQWIRRAIIVMSNNAVIRSTNSLRAPRVPRTRPAAALHLSGDGPKPPKAPPRSRPSHGDPNRLKRANTPFDQVSLVPQIRAYMETGCTLLMYGRRGSPHFRFFFLSGTKNSDGTYIAPRLYWCKEEADRENPETSESFVDLTTVCRVTMGKTPGIFPILARDGADEKTHATEDEDYYTSLAVHYLRDGREPKVLCVTTESKAEMEAWVIGICDVCKVNPDFAEPLPIAYLSKMGNPPIPNNLPAILSEDGVVLSNEVLSRACYSHLLPYCSTDLEVRLCETWHVSPSIWLAIKIKFKPVPGIPLPQLTPGEIRQLFAQLDIFRANAVWELLAQLSLIERAPDSISYLTYSQD